MRRSRLLPSALRDLLFDGAFDLAFFGVHAKHYAHDTPNNGVLRATEMAGAIPNAGGKLALGLACHAGLSTPGEHPQPLDFPEVWSRGGGSYIGSTGWAYH